MRRKLHKNLRSRLNIENADRESIYNELIRFMTNNRLRNSATRDEVAEFFDITRNKATRLLKSFALEGRIRKDSDAVDLYWIEI